MSTRIEILRAALETAFPDNQSISISLDLVSMEVASEDLISTAEKLRDDSSLLFQQMSDLCGVDYATYGQTEWATDSDASPSFSRAVNATSTGTLKFGSDLNFPKLDRPRFAVVYHLLSLDHNVRMRLLCYASNDEMPVVPSVISVWSSADWYEREAFDLFGILFHGHPDLRRLLTDYGFIGHPFRKDFPLIGNVEMRYDPIKERVVYEPVSIEPRVLVPRVIREDSRFDIDEPAKQDDA